MCEQLGHSRYTLAERPAVEHARPIRQAYTATQCAVSTAHVLATFVLQP